MGYLDDAFKYEDQLQSCWDFSIVDKTSFSHLKFKVQDTNIPMYKFTVERKITGELLYKALEDLDSLTITFRESSDFSTFDYFNNWYNFIYDFKQRCFKTMSNDITDSLRNFKVTLYQRYNAEDWNEYTTPMDYSSSVNNINAKQAFKTKPDEKELHSFNLHNCRIIGLDTVSLDYNSGAPLTYTVNILPETID